MPPFERFRSFKTNRVNALILGFSVQFGYKNFSATPKNIFIQFMLSFTYDVDRNQNLLTKRLLQKGANLPCRIFACKIQQTLATVWLKQGVRVPKRCLRARGGSSLLPLHYTGVVQRSTEGSFRNKLRIN